MTSPSLNRVARAVLLLCASSAHHFVDAQTICGTGDENAALTLTCVAGAYMSSIAFAVSSAGSLAAAYGVTIASITSASEALLRRSWVQRSQRSCLCLAQLPPRHAVLRHTQRLGRVLLLSELLQRCNLRICRFYRMCRT